jgi:hypothetical protein
MTHTRFGSFSDFYPYYLSEHSNRICRRLHFIGTTVAVLLLVLTVATLRYELLLIGLAQGYALAWIGHIFFEHNRPATFRHPLYSFIGDWRMWWDVLRRHVTI